MKGWWTFASTALESGGPAAIITVADVSGSAPRDAGTRMVVTDKGQWGTIGGGNLEYQAIKQARILLQEGRDFAVDDYPLGPQLGQCCGGYVRLLTGRLDAQDQDWLLQIERLVSEGKPAMITQVIDPSQGLTYSVEKVISPDQLISPFVATIGAPKSQKPGTIEKSTELISPPDTVVYLFGAGHVGQAVAQALAPLPVRTVWIDSRREYLPTSGSENCDVRHSTELPHDVVAAEPNSLFLVFTHSHDLDYQVVKAVLSRGDFRYCGLIGSRTKRASFESRLRDEGVSEESLGRLICPIGMPSLKSKDPSIIAAGVVAELLTYLAPGQGAGRHGY